MVERGGADADADIGVASQSRRRKVVAELEAVERSVRRESQASQFGTFCGGRTRILSGGRERRKAGVRAGGGERRRWVAAAWSGVIFLAHCHSVEARRDRRRGASAICSATAHS